jgi:hypothetical protein
MGVPEHTAPLVAWERLQRRPNNALVAVSRCIDNTGSSSRIAKLSAKTGVILFKASKIKDVKGFVKNVI